MAYAISYARIRAISLQLYVITNRKGLHQGLGSTTSIERCALPTEPEPCKHMNSYTLNAVAGTPRWAFRRLPALRQ